MVMILFLYFWHLFCLLLPLLNIQWSISMVFCLWFLFRCSTDLTTAACSWNCLHIEVWWVSPASINSTYLNQRSILLKQLVFCHFFCFTYISELDIWKCLEDWPVGILHHFFHLFIFFYLLDDDLISLLSDQVNALHAIGFCKSSMWHSIETLNLEKISDCRNKE